MSLLATSLSRNRRCGPLGAVLLALALLAAACTPERDWRELQWPQGGFSVLLPGKPRKEARTVTIGDTAVPLEMLSLQTKGAAYGVGYADFPPGATPEVQARRLAAARDQLVGNIAGELKADKEISVSGHPGREFRAEGKVAGEPFVTSARVVAVGDRLYEVAVVARAEQAAAADPDLFLGSFKLIGGTSSAAPR
jgi:hypothetical protein